MCFGLFNRMCFGLYIIIKNVYNTLSKIMRLYCACGFVQLPFKLQVLFSFKTVECFAQYVRLLVC